MSQAEKKEKTPQPSFSGLNVGGIDANPFAGDGNKENSQAKDFVPYTPYDPKKAPKSKAGFAKIETPFSNVQTLILRAQQVSLENSVATEKPLPPAEPEKPAPASNNEKPAIQPLPFPQLSTEKIQDSNIFVPQPLEQFPAINAKKNLWQKMPPAARYTAIAAAIVTAHIILVLTLQEKPEPKPATPVAHVQTIAPAPEKQEPVISEIRPVQDPTVQAFPNPDVAVPKTVPQIPPAAEVINTSNIAIPTAKPISKTTNTTKHAVKRQTKTRLAKKITRPTHNFNKPAPKHYLTSAPVNPVTTNNTGGSDLINLLNRK